MMKKKIWIEEVESKLRSRWRKEWNKMSKWSVNCFVDIKKEVQIHEQTDFLQQKKEIKVRKFDKARKKWSERKQREGVSREMWTRNMDDHWIMTSFLNESNLLSFENYQKPNLKWWRWRFVKKQVVTWEDDEYMFKMFFSAIKKESGEQQEQQTCFTKSWKQKKSGSWEKYSRWERLNQNRIDLSRWMDEGENASFSCVIELNFWNRKKWRKKPKKQTKQERRGGKKIKLMNWDEPWPKRRKWTFSSFLFEFMINTILLWVWSFQLNLNEWGLMTFGKKQTSNEGTFPPVLCGCFFLFFIWKIIFFKFEFLFLSVLIRWEKTLRDEGVQ